MAQASSGVVDYGSTSEEDNWSDLESPEEPELPLPSGEPACLRTSRWSDNTDASLPSDCPTSASEQSDSQLDQSAQVPDGRPPEVLTVNSSTDEEGEDRETGATQASACRPEPQQSDDGTQSSTDAGGSSDDSQPSNARSPPSALLVHSSSEDEKPAAKRPRLQISRRGAQGRGAYALQLHQLTPELQDLLARSRAFFTKPHSLQRPGGPVTMSTYSKAQERILCYLGFIQRHLRRQPTPAVLERADFIEEYLDFLREERKLTPATLSNHVSSLLYPVKYKHRASGPSYSHVPIIAQLRRAGTQLQRQGELQRPKTVEQLRALNRWLNWDEVLEACRLQRSRFDVARERRHKAREAADWLLMALYTHIPPSRGLEMRTLEILHAENLQVPFCASDYTERNIALLQQSGAVTIHIQLYKTQKITGHDQVELEVDTELCRLLKQYVKDFRPELCSPDKKNGFLFLNIKGEPFSSGAFSRHIRGLFLKLTGCAVSVNSLRSSFISWAYSQSNCSDSLKDSLAVALRHSREQAQSTYDRRTANQKKAAALQFARQKAESAMGQEHDGGELSSRSDDLSNFSVGDFVGLVMEDSTLNNPCVFVGRIHKLLPGNQVSLLWYKHKGGALYSLEVGGDGWIEDSSALVPITVKPARGKVDCYRLATSLRTIHKAVFDSRSS